MGQKNSFVLYTSYKEHIELLSTEDKARLLDAIFDYADGKTDIEIDGMAKMAFSFIRQQMDKDNAKYEETCEKRRLAGQKGGMAKANARNANQDPSNDNQNDTSEADNEESSSYTPIIKEIISYLNEKTGKSFRNNTKATIRVVKARLDEGFSVDDFKTVIDFKTSQWLHDDKMDEFLRPETLFCASHFDGYLQASRSNLNQFKPPTPIIPEEDEEEPSEEWTKLFKDA